MAKAPAGALDYHVRRGSDGRNIGVGLVWALYLLLISVRQVLLNIVGTPWPRLSGSAGLGLHMPVWPVVIAFTVLLSFAATLTLFGDERPRVRPSSPVLACIGAVVGLYVIALCLINLVSVILQPASAPAT